MFSPAYIDTYILKAFWIKNFVILILSFQRHLRSETFIIGNVN
jgi:hypothetical protein